MKPQTILLSSVLVSTPTFNHQVFQASLEMTTSVTQLKVAAMMVVQYSTPVTPSGMEKGVVQQMLVATFPATR